MEELETKRHGDIAGQSGGAAEKVGQTASQAPTKTSVVVETAWRRAGDLKAMAADRLVAGAQLLRQRMQQRGISHAALAGGDAGVSQKARQRMSGAGEAVAGGMDRTAMWLRESDLAGVGALLDRQLRQHPGRTALAALGIGFLLGRVSRR